MPSGYSAFPRRASRERAGGKVYKDSKLCNVLFAREALRRLPDVRIVSFNPGFIPASGLFRAPRQDNWLGATAFTFFAGPERRGTVASTRAEA